MKAHDVLRIAVAFGLLFTTAECTARRWEYPQHAWYPGARLAMRTTPARALFVGTSRVAASIDTEAFDRLVPRAASDPRVSFNLGQGFSTIVEHALGLRMLADEGRLRDVTVFVEAPLGLPDASRWTDVWLLYGQPQLLLSVMLGRDLPRLWRSDMPVDTKLAAMGRFALGPSRLVTYQERIRDGLLTRGSGAAERLAEVLLPEAWRTPLGASGGTGTLRAVGGIRTDLLDRERARQLAVEEGRRALEHERLVADWDETVVADIVRSVHAAGGRVAFFEMPMSSPQAAPYRTFLADQNRATFDRWAQRQGTVVLRLQRSYSDSDVPDLWHLSAARADEFTADLVRSWLALTGASRGGL